MRTTRTRKPRGGAVVETAVLMIALIPLIMYTFYLSDLLFYHLDQDEAVYSSSWDFLSFDYRHIGEKDVYVADPQPNQMVPGTTIPGWVTRSNRWTYGDHTSAYNTYKDWGWDLNQSDHHQALAAHECWLANKNAGVQDKAEEVTCMSVRKAGGVVDWGNPDGTMALTFGAISGTVYACRARIGVENYFLPTKFLNFGKKNKAGDVGLTPDLDSGAMKRYVQPTGSGSSRNTTITDNAANDAFMFPVGSFRVMHDPWALNWVRSSVDPTHYPRDRSSDHVFVDPEKHPLNIVDSDEITRWTLTPFGLYAVSKLKGKPYDFLDKMVNDKMATKSLGNLEPAGVGGDILYTPPVAFNKARDKDYGNNISNSDKLYSGGYKDSRAPSMTGASATDYLREDESKW